MGFQPIVNLFVIHNLTQLSLLCPNSNLVVGESVRLHPHTDFYWLI